jgi:hypothetical protein
MVKLIHPLDAMVLFKYSKENDITFVKSIGFVPDGAEFRYKNKLYRLSNDIEQRLRG